MILSTQFMIAQMYPPVQYQYSLNWLIGIEGDVWVNNSHRLSILGDPNKYGFILDHERSSYARITNITPIKLIVDVTNNRIVMVTRYQQLLIVSSGQPHHKISDIDNAFCLREGQYEVLIYLTTNGELRLSDNKLIATNVKTIHPMRLTDNSLYHNTLDSVCVIYHNDEIDIMTIINRQLKTTYHSSPITIRAIHFNAIIGNNYLLNFRLTDSKELSPTGTTFSVDNLKDANYMDSISMTDQSMILDGDRMVNNKNEVIVEKVDRVINFLHQRRGCVIMGIDQKTYHLMLGDTRITKRMIDLNIPVVLG